VDPLRGLKDRLETVLSLANDRFRTETADAKARMLSPHVRGADTRPICIPQAARLLAVSQLTITMAVKQSHRPVAVTPSSDRRFERRLLLSTREASQSNRLS